MTQKEEKCCVSPGNYTLTCSNTRHPHGWKKGFITINGAHYCDDFMGFKAMRRITVKGNEISLAYNTVAYSRDSHVPSFFAKTLLNLGPLGNPHERDIIDNTNMTTKGI